MAVNLTQTTKQAERAVLRAFNDAVQSVKDQAVIKEMAALIDARDIEGAVNLLQLDPATFRPLENAITAAYEEGGAVGAAQIGRIPVESGTLVARFNVRNPRAEEWLRKLSSTRIVEIADETKAVVRSVLTEGIARGQGPRTAALDLVGRIDPQTRNRVGGYIGMTENQARWTANARRELNELDSAYLDRALRDKRLDAAFKKAIEQGKPLTNKQIDTAISRLQARTIRYRGEVVSRTESLNALRAGQNEAIMQAVETGELDSDGAYKVWDSESGRRTRPAHLEADGQKVPIDQPFIVGGEALMYPGDPAGSAANTIQCRCRSRAVVDFAGQAAKEIRGFG